MVERLSVLICEQEFLLSRYSSGLYHLQDQLWEKWENVKTEILLRMNVCLSPCARISVVTELWGIYSNVFSTLGVHCFSSSYQNLPRSESFALFRDFFQLVKASGLTRNQNGMLHYVRTACLVCFLRNNQEKLYVKRHRCSFLRKSFILLKYKMSKSSWNLEQYVFCIPT